MVVTGLLYMGIAVTSVGVAGAGHLGEWTWADAAPLESVLSHIGASFSARVVALGALTAMLGVLLNLLMGLSRVLLAMGRRLDMPKVFGQVRNGNPNAAILGVAVVIGVIALPGQVSVSWSFSAFTVLIYYSITNLSALALPPEHRLYPRLFSWCGLAACLFLAFQVGPRYWGVGLGVLGAGLVWHMARGSRRARPVR
jgi:APA family basic amino acid/polyamine antiporter